MVTREIKDDNTKFFEQTDKLMQRYCIILHILYIDIAYLWLKAQLTDQGVYMQSEKEKITVDYITVLTRTLIAIKAMASKAII